MLRLVPFRSEPGHYGFALMRGLMDAVHVKRSTSGTTVTLERAMAVPEPAPARVLRLV